MVEIYKSVGRPQLLAEFFPRDDFSGSLQQVGKYLKRLFLQPYSRAVLAQFPGCEVRRKHSEANNFSGRAAVRRRHGSTKFSIRKCRRERPAPTFPALQYGGARRQLPIRPSV